MTHRLTSARLSSTVYAPCGVGEGSRVAGTARADSRAAPVAGPQWGLRDGEKPPSGEVDIPGNDHEQVEEDAR
jgi:hypothetical protein